MDAMKRLYKFVLKRLLRDVVEKEISTEQFEVSLTDGIVDLRDLRLNIDSINAWLAKREIPLRATRGRIGRLKFTFNLHQHCIVEVDGLDFDLSIANISGPSAFAGEAAATKEETTDDALGNRIDGDSSIGNSTSGSSKKTKRKDESDTSEDENHGLNALSSWLDNFLANVRIVLTNTSVSLQKRLVVYLAHFELRNESSSVSVTTTSDSSSSKKQSRTSDATVIRKIIRFRGFRVLLLEPGNKKKRRAWPLVSDRSGSKESADGGRMNTVRVKLPSNIVSGEAFSSQVSETSFDIFVQSLCCKVGPTHLRDLCALLRVVGASNVPPRNSNDVAAAEEGVDECSKIPSTAADDERNVAYSEDVEDISSASMDCSFASTESVNLDSFVSCASVPGSVAPTSPDVFEGNTSSFFREPIRYQNLKFKCLDLALITYCADPLMTYPIEYGEFFSATLHEEEEEDDDGSATPEFVSARASNLCLSFRWAEITNVTTSARFECDVYRFSVSEYVREASRSLQHHDLILFDHNARNGGDDDDDDPVLHVEMTRASNTSQRVYHIAAQAPIQVIVRGPRTIERILSLFSTTFDRSMQHEDAKKFKALKVSEHRQHDISFVFPLVRVRVHSGAFGLKRERLGATLRMSVTDFMIVSPQNVDGPWTARSSCLEAHVDEDRVLRVEPNDARAGPKAACSDVRIGLELLVHFSDRTGEWLEQQNDAYCRRSRANGRFVRGRAVSSSTPPPPCNVKTSQSAHDEDLRPSDARVAIVARVSKGCVTLRQVNVASVEALTTAFASISTTSRASPTSQTVLGLCVQSDRLEVVLREDRPYAKVTDDSYDFTFRASEMATLFLHGPSKYATSGDVSRIVMRVRDVTLYEGPQTSTAADALVPVLHRMRETCMGEDDDEGVVVLDMLCAQSSSPKAVAVGERGVLDIKTKVHMRGMCYRHRVASNWILQIMTWLDYTLASIEAQTGSEAAATAASIVAPSEYTYGNTVCHLMLSVVDSVIDFSPPNLDGRAIISVGLKLTSNIVSYGLVSGFKIEFDQLDTYISPRAADLKSIDVVCGSPIVYGVSIDDWIRQRDFVRVGRVLELHIFLRFFLNSSMELEKKIIDIRGASDRSVVDWDVRADSLHLLMRIVSALTTTCDNDANDVLSSKVESTDCALERDAGAHKDSTECLPTNILADIDFNAFDDDDAQLDENIDIPVDVATDEPDTIENLLIDEYYRPPDSPKAVHLRDEDDWTIFDFVSPSTRSNDSTGEIVRRNSFRRPDLNRGISVDSAKSEKKTMLAMERVLRDVSDDSDDEDDEDDDFLAAKACADDGSEDDENDNNDNDHDDESTASRTSPAGVPGIVRRIDASIRGDMHVDCERYDAQNREDSCPDDSKFGISSMMVDTGEGGIVQLDLDDSIVLRKQLARLLGDESDDGDDDDEVAKTDDMATKMQSSGKTIVRKKHVTFCDSPHKNANRKRDDLSSKTSEHATNFSSSSNTAVARSVDTLDSESKWFDGPQAVRLISDHVEVPSSDFNAEDLFKDRTSAASLQFYLRGVQILLRLRAGRQWGQENCVGNFETKPSDLGDAVGCDGKVASPLNSSTCTPRSNSEPASLLDAVREDHYAVAAKQGDERDVPVKQIRSKRDDDFLELRLYDTQVRFDKFDSVSSSQDTMVASTFEVAVKNVTITDCIAASSVRSMLAYWEDEDLHPRETHSSALRLSIETLRPAPNAAVRHGNDVRARIALLPIRLNLDQEALHMISRFLSEYASEETENATKQGRDKKSSLDHGHSPGTFFRIVKVLPVKLMIDYIPRRVPGLASIGAGDVAALLCIIPLNKLELTLCRVTLESISGISSIFKQIGAMWCDDVLRKQLHRCLAGIQAPPLRTLSNLGSGVADLVLLPIVQYRQDGRAFLGLKRGASSFFKALTVETLETASRVTSGARAMLETLGSVVVADAAIGRHARHTQPVNVTDGVNQAYETVVDAVHRTARCVIAVPMAEYDQVGPTGAIRSVIRAVPVAVLSPAIGATDALSKILLGARNAVNPKIRFDDERKYKAP